MGDVRILVSQDPTEEGYLWHMSVSHPDRYPSWDEIMDAREQLLPMDRTFVQILPGDADGEYVNVHEHCLHIWEYPSRRDRGHS